MVLVLFTLSDLAFQQSFAKTSSTVLKILGRTRIPYFKIYKTSLLKMKIDYRLLFYALRFKCCIHVKIPLTVFKLWTGYESHIKYTERNTVKIAYKVTVLYSVHRLIILCTYIKLNGDDLNSFKIVERSRFVTVLQTDRWTYRRSCKKQQQKNKKHVYRTARKYLQSLSRVFTVHLQTH